MLIVLDDFEQIVDAAPVLVRLYTVAPLASFLVTSRIVLRIRGEQVYEVESLRSPEGTGPDQPRDGPAVVRRSRCSSTERKRSSPSSHSPPRTRPRSQTSADSSRGCPWRSNWPPRRCACSRRSTSRSAWITASRLLTAAARDMPSRHRTMRATIDWSVSLLTDEQRGLLEDLGVFATRFTLEAVEAIGRGRSWDGQAIDALSELVDASLVKSIEIDGRSTFSLLAIMREYAIERLEERGEADVMRIAHADYYTDLVRRVAPGLRGAGQAEAVKQLGLELSNLRAAVRHLIDTNRLDDAGDFAWTLFVYWWISGFLSEVRLWMLELLEKQQPISQHTRAVAQFFALWAEMWQRPSDQVVAGLGECARLFAESGDEDAAAIALAGRATARLQFPDLDADGGRGRADRSGRQVPPPRRRLVRVHGRGGPRLGGRRRRPARRRARPLRPLGGDRRRGTGSVHARCRRQQPHSRAVPHGRAGSGRAGVVPDAPTVDPPALRRGHHVRARRPVRHRRDAG